VSDDEFANTPTVSRPPVGMSGSVLEHRVAVLEGKMDSAKAIAITNREMLIEIAGKSGTNGKLSYIKDQVEEIQEMFENQRKFIFKMVLAVLATTGAGTVLGQALMSAM
jgi:1-aminocyclopropane-1-carboxylate deaminase/D-cysteine desulfhydrase-like pyridoxal-dependent ACC family enzyme